MSHKARGGYDREEDDHRGRREEHRGGHSSRSHHRGKDHEERDRRSQSHSHRSDRYDDRHNRERSPPAHHRRRERDEEEEGEEEEHNRHHYRERNEGSSVSSSSTRRHEERDRERETREDTHHRTQHPPPLLLDPPHYRRPQQSTPFHHRPQEVYELFIRDLPENCTDEELTEPFRAYRVIKARVMRDKVTHERRNCGFVDLADREEAFSAVSMSTVRIRGKEVVVQFSRRTEENLAKNLPRLRVGVYFGSFDPIHENHVVLVEFAIRAQQLDKLVIVPNPDQPTKPFISPLTTRVRMLEARFKEHPQVIVFPYVQGRRFTWQGRGNLCSEISSTLARGESPANDICKAANAPFRYTVDVFQIIGQDSFEKETAQISLSMPNVYQRLYRKLVVFPREAHGSGSEVEVKEHLRDVVIVEKEYKDPIELSSTAIRSHIVSGQPGDPPGLHPDVAKIVREERLYLPLPPNPRAQIVFVLGGPGAGKGALSQRLHELFGFTPISPGEFYRSLRVVDSQQADAMESLRERKNSDFIKALVPFTNKCISRALTQSKSTRFIVDRIDPDALVSLAAFYGGTPDLVVHLECSPETMLMRINHRVRDGDTPESNEARVQKFAARSADYVGTIKAYEKLGFAPVIHVDAETSIDEYLETSGLLAALQDLQVRRPFERDPAAEGPIQYLEIAAQVSAEMSVAGHYNSLVRNKEERRTSLIQRLRNFNNCCKGVLIRDACGDVFERLGAPPGKLLNVLDLCCGKGGDVSKLNSFTKSYVGADIASVSLDECRRRCHRQFPGPTRVAFLAADCCDTLISSLLEKDDSRHFYHFVNCQFSLHYSFKNEEMARCLLSNAANRLAIGGTFVATFPNMETILARLQAARSAAQQQQQQPVEARGGEPDEAVTENGDDNSRLLEFGNSIYRLTFAEDPFARDFSVPDADFFGIKYRFNLQDAIDDYPEFLVHLPTLERLARDYGLRIVRNAPCILELTSRPYFSESERMLYRNIGGVTLSDDEEAVASLYQAVTFVREAPSQDQAQNEEIITVEELSAMSEQNNSMLERVGVLPVPSQGDGDEEGDD